MKSIELKVAKENIGGRDTFLTSYDLLKSVINSPTKEGLSVAEMMQRLRLLDKVDAHKGLFDINSEDFNDSMLDRTAKLELEDSDFSKLKELFEGMKWGVVSKTIVELSKEFDQ
jgi:hypothetical protein